LKNYGGPEDAGPRGMKFYDGKAWMVTKKLEFETQMTLFPDFFKKLNAKHTSIQVIPFPKDFQNLPFESQDLRKRPISDFTLIGKLEPQKPKPNDA